MSFSNFNYFQELTLENGLPAFFNAARLAEVHPDVWSQFYPIDLDADDFLSKKPQGEDKGEFQGEDKQEDHQAKHRNPFWQNTSVETESEVRKRYRNWLGPVGMCQGLSIEFLVLASEDIDNSVIEFRQKMTARNLRQKSADGSGSYTASKTGRYVFDLSVVGNSKHMPEEEGEKDIRYLMFVFGLQHMQQEKFSRENQKSPRDLSGFANFISMKNYFYLISTGTHKMACASAESLIIFFDPNTGFVTCQKPEQLEAFCLTYFNDPRIITKPTLDLTVERFKKM